MAYDIALTVSGTRTEIATAAVEASVDTITEGLDTLDVDVTWRLEELREDPNYDLVRYAWPAATTTLELTRQDTGTVVFSGRVHGVKADREAGTFTLSAQG